MKINDEFQNNLNNLNIPNTIIIRPKFQPSNKK